MKRVIRKTIDHQKASKGKRDLASVAQDAVERMKHMGRPPSLVTPETRRRFLFDDKALTTGSRDLFAKVKPMIDINEVVDVDDQKISTFVSQELVGNLLNSLFFRLIILCLIVVNSALIGIGTVENMHPTYRNMITIFDQAVLAIFTCEILLKWYYGFRVFWKDSWNIMDFSIIAALILGPQLKFLSSGRVLRILRVLRAFRSLRSISSFAGLSMLVKTCLQSVPDMLNVIVLLCIILIVLGVFGVTLFRKLLPNQFGDLNFGLFTLFVCVTQDGWVEIYSNIKQLGNWKYAAMVYFFVAILIGAFIFANLVVAVVVTNLEYAMKESAAERAQDNNLNDEAVDEESDDDDFEELKFISNEQAHKDVKKDRKLHPMEAPDLKGFNNNKMVNLMLVLNALEENYTEYQQIRADLEKMHTVIKELNDQLLVDNSDDAARDSDEALKVLNKGGDIMTQMMILDERGLLDTGSASSMSNLIENFPFGKTKGRKQSKER